MKKLSTYSSMLTLLFLMQTNVAHAAAKSFKELVLQLVNIIDGATIALFGVAVLFFFWQLMTKLWRYNQGGSDSRRDIQQTISYGLLAIFVMASLWGIISILQQTLSGGLG